MFKVTPQDGGAVKYYHHACFICTACNTPIGQKKYGLTHGRPVHEGCMHSAKQSKGDAAEEFAEGIVCKRCNEPIRGQKKEVPGFGSYHLTCFRCCACGLGITQEYYKDDATGDPRCHRCPQ
jgi:hypothetical protein